MPIAFLVTVYVFAFLFGACVFSFGNVLVYRIPNHLDFVHGRSFCPKCKHALKALDLVPLFSWLFLGAKCRYCGAPISRRYPLVELLGGAAGCLCYFRFGFTLHALAVFFAVFFLAVIALIDADTMEIPDGLVIALAVTAILDALCNPGVPLLSRVIGIFAVSVPMMLLNLAIPTSFGGGDVKVVAAAGFLLGWRALLVGTFIALVTGGGYGALLLAQKKAGRKDHFAFGPFLNFGLAAAAFFGEALFFAYLGLF